MRTKEQTNNALRAAFEYLSGAQKTSFKKMAVACGCTSRHLSGMVSNGKTKPRNMSGDLARKIAEFYGLDYDQFLALGNCILNGAKGEDALKSLRTLASRANPETRHVDGPALRLAHGGVKSTDADQQVANTEPAAMPDRKRLVPLISFVQAGHWATAVDNFHPGDAEEWIACASNVGPRAFALRVKGPSMEPEFREGEIIVVDPDIDAVSNDFVVAKSGDEEATFKKYLRDGGQDYLVPLNGDFKTMNMTGKEWRIVGRVMEKIKKY